MLKACDHTDTVAAENRENIIRNTVAINRNTQGCFPRRGAGDACGASEQSAGLINENHEEMKREPYSEDKFNAIAAVGGYSAKQTA